MNVWFAANKLSLNAGSREAKCVFIFDQSTKRDQLSEDLNRLHIDVCCIQKTEYRVETYDDSRLLSAGDVQPNPGPVQCPCGICGKGVRRNHRGIACDGCDKWHQAKCIDMTTAEYIQLSNSTDYWHCRQCVLPQFTDSFFDSSSSSSSPGSQQYEHSYDLFQQLDSVRMSCPKNIMISHLNINSVRYKFHELSDLFNRSLVDIRFIDVKPS